MQTTTNDTKQLSAIERALIAAKARKAAKVAAGLLPETPEPTAASKVTKAIKASSEDRDAARTKRDEERVERLNAKAAKLKAEEEAKAAKKAAKEAAKAADSSSKKPAHMKKVDAARAKCPTLNSEAEKIFGEITANFSAQQIDALAQHLMVHNRATATLLATQREPLPLGATVRITGGEAKYVGLTGEVVHSQKLRAKVAVPGVSKPVYIYNGQAEVVTAEAAVAV